MVNDVCENAVQMATDFNEKVTKDEQQRKYLFSTVKQQRRDNSDLNRQALQPDFGPKSHGQGDENRMELRHH